MDENELKLRIFPNRKDLSSDYVLDCLFNLTKKEKEVNLGHKAKLIIKKAAQRGEQGLFSHQWEEQAQELGLTQSQYFYIVRILKNAGIIYKSKGRYYISRSFAEHLAGMATAFNAFMMDLGVA